jgi:flagellar biosynthesis protein FlhA
MQLGAAVQNFSLLTIGDGLVAQIPSLLMSIAAAIIVTRVSNEQDISTQTVKQLFNDTKPIYLTAAIIFSLSIIPSMPHIPFMTLSAILVALGYSIKKKTTSLEATTSLSPGDKPMPAFKPDTGELDWEDVVSVDRISLQVGYGLIGLVGASKDGILINRIRNIRKKLSLELGFLVPSIHVRDNLNMTPSHYSISLKNVTIAEADAFADKIMAINPGYVTVPLNGISCKDPSFNLDAYWISPSQRDYATGLGYTVVDCSTVIATHLNQLIKTNAQHLLGYDEVQQIINRLTQSVPKLVETLTSGAQGLPINIIVSVLQKLLSAGIPLIDMRTIAEKMIDSWAKNKDIDYLYESVRIALKNLIVYNINQSDKKIPVAMLDDGLAQILHKSIQPYQDGGEKVMMLEPTLSERIYTRLLEYVHRCEAESIPAVMLVARDLRPLFERLFKASIPNMHFLSTEEIPEDRQVILNAKIG